MKTTVFLASSLLLLVSCEKKSEATSSNTNKKLIDLTHVFSKETVYWVTAEEFKLDTVYNGRTPKGYFYAANNYSAAEHGGTHIDAPIHFAEGKQSVDEIPLEKLMGKAVKIDVSEKALANRDYLVTVEDFLAWEKKEKTTLPKGGIILLQTGYSKYYPDKLKYLGTNQRGDQAVKELHFPGLSPTAAKWLVEKRNINAIGIDTPSIDYGQSTHFESHVTLLSKNIPVFENVANLDQLPNQGFEIIALPMHIKDGSGAPLRIVAIIGE